MPFMIKDRLRFISTLFLLCAVLLTLPSSAQDCTKETLRKKPGTWKAGPQGSIHNVSEADLSKEKAVIADIHKLITTNYVPMGCQVSTSMVFGKNPTAGQTWIADPYHYAMYILRYICDEKNADKSKYYVDASTPTTVDVTANVIYWLNDLYAASMADDDVRGYLKLKQRPQKKDGLTYMGEEVVGDSQLENKIVEYRWLITYNDTLPFSYLTRKEYLMIQKKRLEQSMKDNPGDNGYSNKFLKNISLYLAKPESELNQPAICMWNDEERFEKFVEEGTRGSFFAVKPNLEYYNKKLPKSSPQFMTVVFTISHGDPVFEENMAGIKKAVDFAALKNMLGK